MMLLAPNNGIFSGMVLELRTLIQGQRATGHFTAIFLEAVIQACSPFQIIVSSGYGLTMAS